MFPSMRSRRQRPRMRLAVQMRHLLFAVALATAGCAITPNVQYWPETPAAKEEYLTGRGLLETAEYDLAASAFAKSIELEETAILSHLRLGIAWYGAGRFDDAAACFGQACQMFGGPDSGDGGAGMCVLQASSLIRAGRVDEAHAKLEAWSKPSITMVGTRAINTSAGTLPSKWWREMAGYLMGEVSESDVLDVRHEKVGYFSYLIVGLHNSAQGERETAVDYLEQVLPNVTQNGWRHDLAIVELRRIEGSVS